jgi:FG-GAP repeat
MSNKILMVGALACLSAVAVAQSDQNKEKAPAQAQASGSQDAASAQTTGKRMHKPITVTAEVGVQDAAANKPTSKTAVDDWQAPAAKTTQQPKITENNKSRVAAADVNGDGKADVAAPKAPATLQTTSATSASSDVKSPRDIATGQSSGKRQQEPATATKETEAKPKQK